jgi:hypothetical protein
MSIIGQGTDCLDSPRRRPSCKDALRYQARSDRLNPMALIRFGGQVNYTDFRSSSSFVVESLQAVGGAGISAIRSLVAAAERPAAI